MFFFSLEETNRVGPVSVALLVTFIHSFSQYLLPSERVWPSGSESSVTEWEPWNLGKQGLPYVTRDRNDPYSCQTPRTSIQGPDYTVWDHRNALFFRTPSLDENIDLFLARIWQKEVPTSGDPAIHPLGSGFHKICSSAQLWGSVAWRLLPQAVLSAPVGEVVRRA